MAEGMWAAAGIRMPQLSARERDHLAVLRVTLLAADPAEERLRARRADVAVLLAAVDRLAQGPSVESLMVVDKVALGSFFAGSMQVFQGGCRLPAGRRRKGRRHGARRSDERAS